VCGISGVFQKGSNNFSINFQNLENYIDSLINSVKLRGPNNSGKLKLEFGFLGHTRLAIRDLSPTSNQPINLIKNKGSFVYNGEIYNNFELLKKYSLGNANSDTLSLKKLFEYQDDISFINDLIGDFAIAFWNKRTKRLYLIRDHIGKKPLYYCSYENYFLFNSSIRGIQEIIKSDSIDNEAFVNYLVYGNMFKDKSIFQEIKQVLPGEIIFWDAYTGQITREKFFDFKDQILNTSYLNLNYDDLTKLFSENVEKVIKSHLCSDVPISLLLSSGIDSKLIAKYSLSSGLKAYTADFKENYKEVNDALEFTKYLSQVDHEIVNIQDYDVFQVLEEFIYFIGEPFADASVIPLSCLYQNLPMGNKVVLQGDGGDELFGGYRRYQSFDFFSNFPNNNIFKLLQKYIKNRHRFKRFLYLTSLNDKELYRNIMTTDYIGFNTISLFSNFLNRQEKNFERAIGNEYLKDFKKTKNSNTAEKLSIIDFLNQLPSQFLYKVDRASMMNGIEARVPLVDLRILKFVFSINPKVRFMNNPQKKFLRDSVDIPSRFKNTPKRGFGTPISVWLKESKPYIEKNILNDSFVEYFMLEKKNIKNLINVNKFSAIESYSLWKILCLSIWFKKVFKK